MTRSDTAATRDRTDGARGRVNPDIWVALVILLFCGFIYWITLRFPPVPPSLARGMGAAEFPQLVVSIIAVLALALAWASWRKPAAEPEVVGGEKTYYLTVVLLTAIVALLPYLGIYISAFIVFFGIAVLWGERRYAWLLGSVIGLCAATYVIFSHLLSIRMPTSVILPGPF